MNRRRRAVWIIAWMVLLAGCGPRFFELTSVPEPDVAAIDADLFLIGDAGRPLQPTEPMLTALQQVLVKKDTTRSLVVFLGDNVYPDGLPPEGHPYRNEAERILRAQIAVLRATGVPGVFVPGNHDWHAGGPEGLRRILLQDRFIDTEGAPVAQMLPNDGCPGPEVVDVGERLRLIVLDTQWWLNDFHPDRPEDFACASESKQNVVNRIHAALWSAGTRESVVVAHHPLVSGGPHGGYFDGPARVLGPAVRMGVGDQNLYSAEYLHMIGALTAVMAAKPPLAYAAGHEHNLQVLKGASARYYLVSGSGIYGHLSPARVVEQTLYARAMSGFMRLTLLKDGRSRLGVWVVLPDGKVVEEFSMWLDAETTEPPSRATPETQP